MADSPNVLDQHQTQANQDATTPPSTNQLLTIPPEIRLMIYDYLIADSNATVREIHKWQETNQRHVPAFSWASQPLSQVCHQLHDEFEPHYTATAATQAKTLTIHIPGLDHTPIIHLIHHHKIPTNPPQQKRNLSIKLLLSHQSAETLQHQFETLLGSFSPPPTPNFHNPFHPHYTLSTTPANPLTLSHLSRLRQTLTQTARDAPWSASPTACKIFRDVQAEVISARKALNPEPAPVLRWGDRVQSCTRELHVSRAPKQKSPPRKMARRAERGAASPCFARGAGRRMSRSRAMAAADAETEEFVEEDGGAKFEVVWSEH